MSKQRARRREERAAETARKVAAAKARTAKEIQARRRRDRRAAAVRSLVPRGTGWSRRTREQRAITVVVLLAIAVAAYVLLDSWAPRVGVVLLALLATPAVVTMILDRSTR